MYPDGIYFDIAAITKAANALNLEYQRSINTLRTRPDLTFEKRFCYISDAVEKFLLTFYEEFNRAQQEEARIQAELDSMPLLPLPDEL